MKKAILMLILFAFAGIYSAVQAQTFAFPVPTAAVKDSIKDTGVINLVLPVNKQWAGGAIQVVNTKVSGTVAGTTILQYSVDGVNYHTFNTVGDTLTNTNVTTNSKIWTLTNQLYPYYRLRSTGSGTMVAVSKGYVYFKKQ